MKLILFGGVQGVGKTTLLNWLKNKFADRIELLDPGELFRRYVYSKKIKTTEEVEELIVSKIEKMPENAVVVLHWHYAVRRPTRFIPQISLSRLKRITENNKLEKAVLLLVEAPIGVVRERRITDRRMKKRAFSRSTISEEIAVEEEYLAKHHALFSQALGSQRVILVRLANVNLETAKLVLYGFFKSLLSDK